MGSRLVRHRFSCMDIKTNGVVSRDALGTVRTHVVVNNHNDLALPDLPKILSETSVPQQSSSLAKQTSANNILAKQADQQTSRTIGDGSRIQLHKSTVGSNVQNYAQDAEYLENQRTEDRAYNILPLPQASSQMLPPGSAKTLNQVQKIREQALRGCQTEQPTLPTATSSVPTRINPVNPNTRKGIPNDRPKVVKSRRKPMSSRPSNGPDILSQRPVSEAMPTVDDLIQILQYRNQQEKKARDTAKAMQQARDAEFQNTKEAYALLRSQMEEISRREKAQQIELAKYQKVLPEWKSKARKLEDYLKGLTNDHHKLRDDAQSIQRQQLLLQTDKDNIMTNIEETHSALGRHAPGAAKIVSDALHHIEIVTEKHDAQSLQAQQDAKLLEAEQERSQRLEHEISKISSNQQQITNLLHAQRLELMEKLSETLTNSSTVLVSEPSEDQAGTKDLLDQCIAMLHEIKTVKHVEPEDMERRDSSIKGYAE